MAPSHLPADPKLNGSLVKSTSNTVALGIAGTVVVATFGLMFPFVSSLRQKVFLPYMATPKSKVRAALEHAAIFISKSKPAGVSRQFIDLGSGDGEAVYQAVQVLNPPLDRSIGIEINPTLFAIASLRRLTWNADQRRRSRFLCGSFWDHSLSPYGVVMIFGVPPLMADLSIKIQRECKPGTVVLSYRFPLPVDTGKHGNASMIRNEAEMFTYVLTSDTD